MNQNSLTFAGDPELARCVDDACNRFASAWQSGTRPFIENFLTSVPSHGREVLFQELLHEDLRFRRRAAEVPSRADYESRFPEYLDMIRQIVGETPSPLDSTDSFRVMDGTAKLSDSAPSGPASGSSPEGSVAGCQIAGYQIVGELGQGGMGVVYLAKQLSAGRLVALKVIRPEKLEGRATELRRETLARFHREALASAKLQDDHLVTVYDVGESHGRPYYAMRYVPGCSLKERLQDGPLPDREAASLMIPVCRAVHVAHQAGVLHRDLKPHNILLEAETGRPLVTDFGLAKLCEGSEQITVSGEVFGSPPYMSPEQALNANLATASSDVYGLGATLYHVLTGRPPFQAASVPETLRQVLDAEPVPPQQMNRDVSRDMETICLKCLSKEPARRYESAAELADDLQRFLDHRPIVARPISLTARIGRWARRNRWVAGLLVALFCSLSVGLAGVTWQWRRANSNLVLANENLQLAQSNLGLAQTRLRQAQEVVKDVVIRVGKHELRDIPQMEPLRKALMEKAVGYFEDFLQQAANDPSLRRDDAIARLQLGNVYKWMGEEEKAQNALETSIDRLKSVLANDSSDAKSWDALSVAHAELGGLHLRAGRTAEAEQHFQADLEVNRQRSPNDLETMSSFSGAYNNLATFYREQGKLPQAVNAYELAVEYALRLLDRDEGNETAIELLASQYYNLALVQNDIGQTAEARTTAAKALPLLEKWNQFDPKSVHRRQLSAGVLQGLSWFDNSLGKPDQALVQLQQAITVMEDLNREHPQVPEYIFELARLLCSLSHTQGQLKKYEESRTSLDRAISLLEPLHAEGSHGPDITGQLGEAYVSRGWQQQATADAQVPQTYERAFGLLTSALKSLPNNLQYQLSLAQGYHELGIWYSRRDLVLSRENYEQAVNLRERLPLQSSRALDGLAWSCKNLSYVLLDLGDPNAAVEKTKQALVARKRMAGNGEPSSMQAALNLANEHMDAAVIGFAAGHFQFARETIQVATDMAFSALRRELDNKSQANCRVAAGAYVSWTRLKAEFTTLGTDGSHLQGLQVVDEGLAKLQSLSSQEAELAETAKTATAEAQVATPPVLANGRALLRQRRAELRSIYQQAHREALEEIESARKEAANDLQLLFDLTEEAIRARQGDCVVAADRALKRAPADQKYPELVRLQLTRVLAIVAAHPACSANLSNDPDLVKKFKSIAIEQLRTVATRDARLVKRLTTYDPEFSAFSADLAAAR